ncbi:PREDICTED: uncharacterized protein LOC109480905 isoform X2 [Branchiostoma belcheri]|uniref:Uncharacterized protein LOC109480905 isoform X2 n=1 Tax=Branchiostoma belcheri TaxID=7741 RepID=A0A6P5AAL6_BRABE|nr:PREDICTED: uncharacterized protein LOC109480905 isoform X2 [Branchiostoma belcheri]
MLSMHSPKSTQSVQQDFSALKISADRENQVPSSPSKGKVARKVLGESQSQNIIRSSDIQEIKKQLVQKPEEKPEKKEQCCFLDITSVKHDEVMSEDSRVRERMETEEETGPVSRTHWDTEEFLEDEGYSFHYSLLEIFSPEILFHILSHLEWHQLGVVAQTCRTLHEMCQSPALWSRITHLDFRMCQEPTEERILKVLEMCKHADFLAIGSVLTDDLLTNSLNYCLELRNLHLESEQTTDGTVTGGIPWTSGFSLSNHHLPSNLDKSDIENLELTELGELESVDCSKCSGLESVTINCVALRRLDVTECTFLQQVNIKSRVMREARFSDLTALTDLSVESEKLVTLDISYSTELSLQKLLSLPSMSCVETLNITGCKQLNLTEVNSLLLPRMPHLSELVCGDVSSHDVTVRSLTLTGLIIKDIQHLPCVSVNCPSLQRFTVERCADLTEPELLDGLILGRRTKRSQQINKMSAMDEPTCSRLPSLSHGAPMMQHLTIRQIPNMVGSYLSGDGASFVCLKVLEIEACQFMKILEIDGWPSLEEVRVYSSKKLSNLVVINSPHVTTVITQWCSSMMEKFHVVCDKLQTLKTTGCSFANYTVHSKSLKQLEVSGVCMKPTDTLDIRCESLVDLTILKCENLSEVYLSKLLSSCPNVTNLRLSGCNQVNYVKVPATVTHLSLSALRRLSQVVLEERCRLSVLHLSHLPKVSVDLRLQLLSRCQNSLCELELRGLPHETQLSLTLPQLHAFTLDQCIHLTGLDLTCPLLRYLRLQGCPKLSSFSMKVGNLASLQVDHSSPLLSLKSLQLACNNLRFLARILGYYCPNLEELVLSGDNTSMTRVCSIGHNLPCLHTITLQNCTLEEDIAAHFPGPIHLRASELHRTTDRDMAVIFQQNASKWKM